MDFHRFSQIVACWSLFVIACFCIWIVVNVAMFNAEMDRMFGSEKSSPKPDFSKSFKEEEGSRAYYNRPTR